MVPVQFQQKVTLKLPLFSSKVAAGFPSPAEDYEDKKLDLNELLIDHPASTFFVTVQGESMIGAGIFPGDMLVIDRKPLPKDGDVILAVVDGDFTVKRFFKIKNGVRLEADNPSYDPIIIREGQEFEVWGVVITSLRFPSASHKPKT